MKSSCLIPGCHCIAKLFGSKTTDFEVEALEVHNQYRREHGVPPLTLNKEISKFSQKRAEELAKKDALSYSNNDDYGESVYCGWSPDPNVKITAKDCVDKWYSEINSYSAFGKEPTVLNCGHFTQIIWKATKELGIGSAKSKTGKLYVVANYSPPGNYSGQFINNVLPPGANQFSPDYQPPEEIRETNNNLSPRSPPSPNQRTSKTLDDLKNKFKSAFISENKFEEDFLKAHNEYRKKHNVPPLELSRKLCAYADEWAKNLVKIQQLQHRQQNDYGENIFFACSSDPNFNISGRDPVDKWYEEIKLHKFGREPSGLSSGHFTQVVWEDTREVGVGTARSNDGRIYVVANYYPPGNIIGSFARKVHPPTQP